MRNQHYFAQVIAIYMTAFANAPNPAGCQTREELKALCKGNNVDALRELIISYYDRAGHHTDDYGRIYGQVIGPDILETLLEIMKRMMDNKFLVGAAGCTIRIQGGYFVGDPEEEISKPKTPD